MYGDPRANFMFWFHTRCPPHLLQILGRFSLEKRFVSNAILGFFEASSELRYVRNIHEKLRAEKI